MYILEFNLNDYADFWFNYKIPLSPYGMRTPSMIVDKSGNISFIYKTRRHRLTKNKANSKTSFSKKLLSHSK